MFDQIWPFDCLMKSCHMSKCALSQIIFFFPPLGFCCNGGCFMWLSWLTMVLPLQVRWRCSLVHGGTSSGSRWLLRRGFWFVSRMEVLLFTSMVEEVLWALKWWFPWMPRVFDGRDEGWRWWWCGSVWLASLVSGGSWHVLSYGWIDLKVRDCHMPWSECL